MQYFLVSTTYLPSVPYRQVPSGPKDPFHFPGPSRDLSGYRDDVTLIHDMRVEPVAKNPRDKMSLLKAAVSGDPKVLSWSRQDTTFYTNQIKRRA